MPVNDKESPARPGFFMPSIRHGFIISANKILIFE